MKNRNVLVVGTLMVLGAGFALNTASADIGTVAAVNQQMDGTPPQRETRKLIIGDKVVSNERVQTSDIGSGQLLFVDQTSLTVASNSDIVLDRYIFDPEKKAGDVAMSIARGSVRFIGGLITKKSTAVIRTPTSTIGIRGGMALIEVDEAGTRVTNVASISVTVETYGDADGDGFDDGPAGSGEETGEGGGARQPESRVVLTRTSATATSDETGTTYAGIASDQQIAAAYQSFEGGGDGGIVSAPNSETTNGGADTIATINSQETGGVNNAPVTTDGSLNAEQFTPEQTDPNTANQDDNSVADQIAAEEPITDGTDSSSFVETTGDAPLPPPDPVQDPIDDPMFGALPDPADIASLTGTAVYNGIAVGSLTDTKGVLPPVDVTGTSLLQYDFARRNGALQLNIGPGSFTVDVNAGAANAAQFSGSNAIFGGPDSLSAQGGFRSTQTDPAASVEGTFNLDLQTQSQAINGTFNGDR
ncbi:MAG: FecR domain-containing protein [Pseudomonadota bacterium]